MFVIDPDTAPTDDTAAPDPAAAAAEAPTPEVVPEPDGAGFLKAIEDAGQMPEPELPPGAEPPKPDAAPEPKPEIPAKPDPAVPKAEPDAAKGEPDKAVEDEIAGLKLKDKAAERFRGMAGEIKELAPIRDAMKAAGITDPAELPQIAKRAKDGDDLIQMVTDTGCGAEDFSRVLDYMGTISKGRNGDRAAVEAALKVVGEEYAAIAKALGKEIPGVFDPLAEHADLRQQIDDGDITRAAALELVQARQTAAAQAQRTQQATQQTQAQQAQQQAEQQGIASLQQWEAAKLADPNYAAIRPALNDKVAEIRQQFPPAQWAAATELAYQALAAQARPVAPAKPTPGPVRAGGPRPAMMPTTDDPMEAMMQGIAAATP